MVIKFTRKSFFCNFVLNDQTGSFSQQTKNKLRRRSSLLEGEAPFFQLLKKEKKEQTGLNVSKLFISYKSYAIKFKFIFLNPILCRLTNFGLNLDSIFIHDFERS